MHTYKQTLHIYNIYTNTYPCKHIHTVIYRDLCQKLVYAGREKAESGGIQMKQVKKVGHAINNNGL